MSFHDVELQAGLHGIRLPLTGVGSPVGSVTPTTGLDKGVLYRDTDSGDLWVSTGATSSDWTLFVGSGSNVVLDCYTVPASFTVPATFGVI